MPRPSSAQVTERLADSFALDDLWRTTMGLPTGDTKETALLQLLAVLTQEGCPYAVIGGVAVQIWTEEPRSTRDIDVAVSKYSDLPVAALQAAGFTHEGRFDHSDNWRAPGSEPRKRRTAVQFSVDVLTAGTVERAEVFDIQGNVPIRIACLTDLVALKLEAALEPKRRGSKRVSDYGDVKRLIEEHPELRAQYPDLSQTLAQIRALMGDDDHAE